MMTYEQIQLQEKNLLALFAHHGYNEAQFLHKPIMCKSNYDFAIKLMMKGKHHGTNK